MADILKSRGFEVSAVTTSATPAANTLVVSYTTNAAVVNKLTSLPFKYVLQITRNDAQATQVAVFIGKDFK